MKPKQWELWLGKPRSGWIALIPVIAILITLAGVFIADLFGLAIPRFVGDLFSLLLVGCGICMIISWSAYALVASVLILSPAILILIFGTQEIEKEIWFWVVTASTTLIGSIAFIRYSKIWKMYRG
ncbi:hypothetical protein [Pelagicoccus sp. SDUM812003]|uniref:hypothetical protein n=1 Tax=Pelagicoccus sp. SDUM812003 TaxID=3041267 RepID=UPI00280D5F92|nr:hypothetical protein [Pelagicoccus sp. SDUM812003]MDQ8205740.1 hypothetical protein [Pelagicoccus sp. SDUM812003]